MKTHTRLFGILIFTVALAMNAPAQVYQFSEPLSGRLTMSAEDVVAGGSGAFQLNFNTLSETIDLDTVGNTMRQVGTILYTPSASDIQFTETQGGVSGTVTANLIPTNGDLYFDGGVVSVGWNSSTQTYSYPPYAANIPFFITVVGSYSLVTGGQTLSGTFTYTMNDNQDNDFTAAYTYAQFSLVDDPSALQASGLGDCCDNNGGSCFQSPGVVVDVTASNGFHLQLKPGINPYWASGEGPGELFEWSAPSVMATNESLAPFITSGPQSEVVQAGENASFTVTAVGVPPLSYQWQFDTTNIADATNATLLLTNVGLSDAGSYSVMISDTAGATNSTNAILTVNPAPPCDPPPSGIVGWWPGNGNADDVIAGNNGTLVNGVTFAPGEVGEAFSFNGEDQYVQIADSPALRPASVTLECWFNDSNTSGGNLISKPVGAGDNDSYALWLQSGQLKGTVGNSSTLPIFGYTFTPVPGVWYHAALTFDGGTHIATLYLNGSFVASELANLQIGYDTHPVLMGTEFDSGEPVIPLSGMIDEAAIYDRALSAAEVQAIYEAGTSGKCGAPPTFVIQPQSQVAALQSSVSFTASATGSLPISYQWLFNGTNIPGATLTNLTISDLKQTNLGTYSILAANAYGSTNSSNATLSMYPFIQSPFTGAVTYWGKDATLSVGPGGSGPFDYQWYDNGSPIDGATNETYTLSTIQFTNAGLYSVVVTSPFGSVTNTPEQVVVEPAGVSLGLSPTLTISGVVGYDYIIQSTTNLSDTNAWVTLTNLTLTEPVQLWVDTNTDTTLPGNPQKFYQVLPGQ